MLVPPGPSISKRCLFTFSSSHGRCIPPGLCVRSHVGSLRRDDQPTRQVLCLAGNISWMPCHLSVATLTWATVNHTSLQFDDITRSIVCSITSVPLCLVGLLSLFDAYDHLILRHARNRSASELGRRGHPPPRFDPKSDSSVTSLHAMRSVRAYIKSYNSSNRK